MEEFTGTNEHLTMHVAPTKEAILSGYHNQTSIGRESIQMSRQGSVTPGLRYRNLGKSGLRVSNVGLGKRSIENIKNQNPNSVALILNNNLSTKLLSSFAISATIELRSSNLTQILTPSHSYNVTNPDKTSPGLLIFTFLHR